MWWGEKRGLSAVGMCLCVRASSGLAHILQYHAVPVEEQVLRLPEGARALLFQLKIAVTLALPDLLLERC